jgi:type I restriction enzyme, S subunit
MKATVDPLSALDHVPPHWEVVPLATVASVNARIGWKGLTASEYVDDGYAFLAAPNLKSREIDYEDVNYVTRERYLESPEIALRVGDVLVVKDGSVGIVNVVRHLPRPATVNGSIAVVRPQGIDPEFLALWFESTPMQQHMNRMQDGMGVPHLFQRDMRKFKVPCPKLKSQRAISSFARKETARIDALIQKKEGLITLLEEEWISFTSLAVTGGASSHTETTRSGIPWLGDVPTNWPVGRIGLLARVQTGSTPSRGSEEYWLDGTVPWLASTSLNEGLVLAETERISKTAIDECGLELFRPGTVLVGLVGQGRTRGMSAILGIRAAISQNLAAIVTGQKLSERYLYHYLRHAYQPLRAQARGANQPALDCEVVAEFPVPVPPRSEQARIAGLLDLKGERLRLLTTEIRRSIALLRELRQSLITAVVTGQHAPATGGPSEGVAE